MVRAFAKMAPTFRGKSRDFTIPETQKFHKSLSIFDQEIYTQFPIEGLIIANAYSKSSLILRRQEDVLGKKFRFDKCLRHLNPIHLFTFVLL
jgi:hypothetical protein